MSQGGNCSASDSTNSIPSAHAPAEVPPQPTYPAVQQPSSTHQFTDDIPGGINQDPAVTMQLAAAVLQGDEPLLPDDAACLPWPKPGNNGRPSTPTKIKACLSNIQSNEDPWMRIGPTSACWARPPELPPEQQSVPDEAVASAPKGAEQSHCIHTKRRLGGGETPIQVPICSVIACPEQQSRLARDADGGYQVWLGSAHGFPQPDAAAGTAPARFQSRAASNGQPQKGFERHVCECRKDIICSIHGSPDAPPYPAKRDKASNDSQLPLKTSRMPSVPDDLSSPSSIAELVLASFHDAAHRSSIGPHLTNFRTVADMSPAPGHCIPNGPDQFNAYDADFDSLLVSAISKSGHPQLLGSRGPEGAGGGNGLPWQSNLQPTTRECKPPPPPPVVCETVCSPLLAADPADSIHWQPAVAAAPQEADQLRSQVQPPFSVNATSASAHSSAVSTQQQVSHGAYEAASVNTVVFAGSHGTALFPPDPASSAPAWPRFQDGAEPTQPRLCKSFTSPVTDSPLTHSMWSLSVSNQPLAATAHDDEDLAQLLLLPQYMRDNFCFQDTDDIIEDTGADARAAALAPAVPPATPLPAALPAKKLLVLDLDETLWK